MRSLLTRSAKPDPNRRKVSKPLENTEEDIFQRWLQVPADGPTASEETIFSSTQSNGCLLSEPGFDISDDALFASSLTEAEKEAVKPVVWRRVTGSLYLPTKHYCRLVQGCLSRSRWFLGALAAVSTKRELLLNLIVSDNQAARGLYTFQIHKHGAWQEVVVDNRLPCVEIQQRLAFCSSSTPQELWPSLLEKGYARLHGGYAALAAGSVADALADLTGGIVDTIRLTAAENMSEGALWSTILHHLTAGDIIACHIEQQQQPALLLAHTAAAAAAQAADAPDALLGLLPDSPYSILAARVLPSGSKVLRLHNPWVPEGVWQGPWGTGSAEWSSEEGLAALEADADLAEGLEDPATFWCSFWDFLQMFTALIIAQLPSSHTHQVTAINGWDGAAAWAAGGPHPKHTDAALQLTVPPSAAAMGSRVPSRASSHPLGTHEAGQQQQQQQVQHQQQQQEQQQQQHLQRHLQRRQAHHSCTQVAADCLSMASGPQFRLVAAHTANVVVCLGQRDIKVMDKSYQQQQQKGLHIGLRVLQPKAANSSMRFRGGKALAAAGIHRPMTVGARPVCTHSSQTTCSNTNAAGCTCKVAISGSRCSSRCRSRSKSPSRPGTAPAAAADDDAVDVDASCLHRAWSAEQCCMVCDTGLTDSRDVVLRFTAEQGKSYTLVPYTRHATDTGPFTLRAWAPCLLQLEQLPSIFSLALSSHWLGPQAGGSRQHPSWASNPQYMITCPREATALLCLTRPDVCNSLLQQPYEPGGCIGLTVCEPGHHGGADGQLGGRCSGVCEEVGGSELREMDQVVVMLHMMAERPYVVVPCTAHPGIEVPFELRVLSSHPLELCELPRQVTISQAGKWDAGSAGGCNLHHSWINNPAYTLQLERQGLCRICLTRSKGSWRRNQPLAEMIGLSAIKLTQGQRHTFASLRQQQLHEAAFVPMQACEVEWKLPGGVPLVLVPCTYAPHVQGDFTLAVTADCAVRLELVSGGLAAAAAAASTNG